MPYLKFIPGFLLFAFSACGQTSSGTQTISNETKQNDPSYIIFGVFCGECSGHCATMYRYNMMGNSNTLFVDNTDSYFKNYGKVVCKTQITDIAKFQIVNKLVQQIPKACLKTDKTEQTYGCPDCTDGCGIYFEIGKGSTPKKFYIDYHISELEKEAKDFGEFVKETLTQLNNKKMTSQLTNICSYLRCLITISYWGA
jgi:hypothetical protein